MTAETQKNIYIYLFPWCSTREDLSIDVSITNVGLILTKPGRFLFSGYGQTGIWNPHMEHVSTQKNSNQTTKLGEGKNQNNINKNNEDRDASTNPFF